MPAFGNPTSPASDDPDKDQLLNQIIANHVRAHGGMEVWDKVTALALKGEHMTFSVVHDFYTLKTADGRFYSEYNLGHHRLTEVYNGTDYWSLNPWYETDDPIPMNEAEKNVIRQKALYFSPFYPITTEQPDIEWLGNHETDGMKLITLSVSYPDMPAETWYLDAGTFLTYKVESQWIDFSRPVMAETYFDDYRSVDGIVLPFFIEQTYGTRHTVTQITNIEINPDIAPELFEKPSD